MIVLDSPDTRAEPAADICGEIKCGVLQEFVRNDDRLAGILERFENNLPEGRINRSRESRCLGKDRALVRGVVHRRPGQIATGCRSDNDGDLSSRTALQY